MLTLHHAYIRFENTIDGNNPDYLEVERIRFLDDGWVEVKHPGLDERKIPPGRWVNIEVLRSGYPR